MGKVLAVPAPNKLNKPPTNFEEGPTFVHINGGHLDEKRSRWIKIRLFDEKSFNRYGVGAKIIVNGNIMRRHTVGGESFSGVMADIHVGLGQEKLKKIEIIWPSGEQRAHVITFEPPIYNQRVCINKTKNQEGCP
ncbi:MAG: hypothetical protein GKR87_08060 [Kiritimatiellae bacterium]|nr:hypothetical protein [Kiritimatiellia bacterium]